MKSGISGKITNYYLQQEPTGGKVLFFQSALPTVGVGLLKPRDAETSVLPIKETRSCSKTSIKQLLDTDKEATLFKSQSQFYAEVGVHCAEKHVGVHLFLCSDAFLDAATLGNHIFWGVDFVD